MKNSLKLLLALAVGIGLAARAQDAEHDQSNVPLEVDTKDASLTKIVLIAGRTSHGPGEHEGFAGMALVMNMLKQTPGVFPVMCRDGWPKNPDILNGAKTIVVQSDGGGGHPLLQGDHLQVIGDLMKKGVGLVCIHYAVEPTKEKGEAEFLQWIGGAFEVNWSVNPHWEADFTAMPKHPITRGVQPFKISDEWYFHMRFPEGMKGVTPIFTAVAPASTMSRKDDPHAGNPDVRKAVAAGEPQHMAWAFDRPDGGRGFGLTGAHFHKNYGDINFRRTIVNAILWTAHVEIPEGGAKCELAPDDLMKNLDKKGK